jgi:hypothetical protein
MDQKWILPVLRTVFPQLPIASDLNILVTGTTRDACVQLMKERVFRIDLRLCFWERRISGIRNKLALQRYFWILFERRKHCGGNMWVFLERVPFLDDVVMVWKSAVAGWSPTMTPTAKEAEQTTRERLGIFFHFPECNTCHSRSSTWDFRAMSACNFA